MHQFEVGDRIRERGTGRVFTVTHRSAHCGNVYVGDGGQQREISPSQYEPVPHDAPTQEPVSVPVEAGPSNPTPVATNGNGHGQITPEEQARLAGAIQWVREVLTR